MYSVCVTLRNGRRQIIEPVIECASVISSWCENMDGVLTIANSDLDNNTVYHFNASDITDIIVSEYSE
jgi:hypothetical protein